MKRCLFACSAIFYFLLLSSTASAEKVYTDFFSDKALSGYDTVAYFIEGKAVKGKKKHTTTYLDVDWYFASEKNKKMFEVEPDKYRPQYGGYCAWAAAANNALAKGDPKYWKIVEDKLYLNYNEDVQQKWLQDVAGFILKADQNWPGLNED
ncbi:MAG: YHS domain-containing protein [Agarilytica sp.]